MRRENEREKKKGCVRRERKKETKGAETLCLVSLGKKKETVALNSCLGMMEV